MKMKYKVIIGIVAFVVGAFVWPYVQMEFASSAYYRESDKREYDYYTPELLKNMPRISSNYTFQYMSNHDARSALYGIRFADTKDTSKLRSYLKQEGYEPQTTCDTAAECWRASSSKDVISLYSTATPDNVVVQISRY